jgi:hypothetical protein
MRFVQCKNAATSCRNPAQKFAKIKRRLGGALDLPASRTAAIFNLHVLNS